MKKNFNYLALLSLLTLFVGCATADVEDPAVDAGGQENNGYEMGQSLNLDVFDANSLKTKATEDDTATHFVSGDQIGIFVVIGEQIIQFNECYTMNSEGAWTGEGAYWGDSTGDVHYYAYYPYMNDICFDEIYSRAEDDADGGFAYITTEQWNDTETHPSDATGTADGERPKENNGFEVVENFLRPKHNRKRSVLDSSSEDDKSYYTYNEKDNPNKRYVLQVDYDTVTPNGDDATASNDDGTREASYFFSDLVDKWTPRTYQEGKKYTLSDLMICKGYFSQTAVATYPLTLALRHQMSMMHFEFPAKYTFSNGLKGTGEAVAVADKDAQDAANGAFTDDPSTNPYRSSLEVYIDPVTKTKNTLGDLVVEGHKEMQAKFHDLTADPSSIYYYRADEVDGDGKITKLGNHNEFRYIIRPHTLYDQDLFTDVAGYKGAQVHIKYSYWPLDENGEANTAEEPLVKSFNTIFEPNPNAYVHYLMDDGAIPEGGPTLIRTAGDDKNAGKFPTCVGAFWRHNQSGERIVMIQPQFEEDYGKWRAFVFQMDAGWKNTSDIRLDGSVKSIEYGGVSDAEDFQIETLSQSVSGNCGEGKPILFRIGLTNEDFDMKSPVTGQYLPARYATIMLIYGDGKKYQMIYLRQGEDPDYVYHPEDTYVSKFGYDIQRAYASKLSPYNLTAEAWLEQLAAEKAGTTPASSAKHADPLSIHLNSTAGGNTEDKSNSTDPIHTWTNAAFVEFPSQIGAYFQMQVPPTTTGSSGTYLNDPSYAYFNQQRAFSPISIENGNSGNQPNDVWDLTQEVCPKGYKSAGYANNNTVFDFVRPAGGRSDISIMSYNGTMSQFGQSLYDDPLSNASNCLSGYYADGFHDRRNFADTYSPIEYSSTGILFYNPRDFASVFLPAGYKKVYTTAAMAAPTSPSEYFPPCKESGFYITTTTFNAATSIYVGFELFAPINFENWTEENADTYIPTCKTYSTNGTWYNDALNIRPFVAVEKTAAPTE